MLKDREQTKKSILAAVATLLGEHGFDAIGVNAVARAAGVNKVLIYRYFGGMEGLLQAFARDSDYWPAFNGDFSTQAIDADPAGAAAAFAINATRELKERPTTKEALRMALLKRNALTEVTHDALREVNASRLLANLQRHSRADIPAAASIITCGLMFLALRADTAGRFNGLDLQSAEDWQRLEKSARQLIASTLPSGPSQPLPDEPGKE